MVPTFINGGFRKCCVGSRVRQANRFSFYCLPFNLQLSYAVSTISCAIRRALICLKALLNDAVIQRLFKIRNGNGRREKGRRWGLGKPLIIFIYNLSSVRHFLCHVLWKN